MDVRDSIFLFYQGEILDLAIGSRKEENSCSLSKLNRFQNEENNSVTAEKEQLSY